VQLQRVAYSVAVFGIEIHCHIKHVTSFLTKHCYSAIRMSKSKMRYRTLNVNDQKNQKSRNVKTIWDTLPDIRPCSHSQWESPRPDSERHHWPANACSSTGQSPDKLDGERWRKTPARFRNCTTSPVCGRTATHQHAQQSKIQQARHRNITM